MKFLIGFVLFSLLSVSALSQTVVTGSLLDELGDPMVGATVVLLSDPDSTMMAFAISDEKGSFEIEDLTAGNYILQVTYVSFQTHYQALQLTNKKTPTSLGQIQMKPSSEILQEVEVKAEHIPMGILGDTINYNAAAFKTKPGASVEDLLKKLPGIDVERDGTITALGETVQNVLVDGKEFFGDDPKMATKNLDAEAVDKVQLFDKKSEMEAFTGIEDGEEEKTINLQLKDEYKKGGFGKVALHGGSNERYDGKLNFNRFTPEMQASTIINANNINKQPFSFNEYISFMGGIGNAIQGNSGMLNFSEFGQGTQPQGNTNAISAGLNFNYDFSTKLKLTSHYFLIRNDQILDKKTFNTQFTDLGDYQTQESLLNSRLQNNHQLSVKMKYNPNPLTQVIWKNTGSFLTAKENLQRATQFLLEKDKVGTTSSSNFFQNKQMGILGDIHLKRKSKNATHNWLAKLSYQFGVTTQNDRIESNISLTDSLSILQQIQAYYFDKSNINSSLAYTKTLENGWHLGARYSVEGELEKPKKDFFDRLNNEELLNPNLSGEYDKSVLINEPSLFFRKNSKRVKVNGGLNAQWAKLEGLSTELFASSRISETYLLPQLKISFDIDGKNELDLGYQSNVNLPGLSQLAPFPDNSNPNLLTLGNPDLKPEYVQKVNLGYRLFDRFNFIHLFANVNVQWVDNWISYESTINEQLLNVLKPVNLDQLVSVTGNLNYSAPIKKLKLKFRTSGDYTWSKYVGRLNGKDNPVQENNLRFKLSIDNRKKEKVDISGGVKTNLTIRKYENNASFDQTFFNYSLFLDSDWYLNDTWTFTSNLDYAKYSSEFFSAGQSSFIWNAKLSKSFAENKWTICLQAFDILNQNIGLFRSGGLNNLYEENFNTLNRHFLIGVKYKLGKGKDNSLKISN